MKEPPRESRDQFSAFTIAELLNRPPRRELIKGVLGENEFAVWFGPPACGKTFLALDASLAIARGVEFLGHKTKQGAVVYCALEGTVGISQRLKAYQARHGQIEKLPMLFVTEGVRPDAGAELSKRIRRWNSRPSLVVIDTLNRAIGGGDENDSKTMGQVVAFVDLLRREFECAVLTNHHQPKTVENSAATPRGHGSLVGAADVIGFISVATPTQRTFQFRKAKDFEGIDFAFNLESVSLGTDEDGDPISSCVVVAVDAPEGRQGRKAPVGNAAIVLQALQRVIVDHGELPPASNHIPAHTKVVSVDMWRRYAYAVLPADAGQDAKRKAFSRAYIRLVSCGHVGTWNEQAWTI